MSSDAFTQNQVIEAEKLSVPELNRIGLEQMGITDLPQMMTPKDTYTFDYDEPVQFAEEATSQLWFHTEFTNFESDKQDIFTKLTPAERHGVITVLKKFVKSELMIGSDSWNGRILKSFPRPDIELMASTFGYVELTSHARAYDLLNKAMNLDTDEFYDSYKENPTLAGQMEFVEQSAIDPCLPYMIGVFSGLEGVCLYGQFAFLKSFQNNGKNLMMSVARIINLSEKDEAKHCEAGGWLYRQLVDELDIKGTQTLKDIENRIVAAMRYIHDSECEIIDAIFAKGEIDGITAEDLKTFVKSRVNYCLGNLRIDPIYNVTDNPVGEWFYAGQSGYKLNDFFTAGSGAEYRRDWSLEDIEF